MQMEVRPLLSDNRRLRGMWGWCRVLDDFDGKRYLNREEKDEYSSITFPTRKIEWIAARMIIKEILVQASLISSFQDCSVQKDPYGCPRILIQGELARNYHCTITHKNGLALSAVSFEEAIYLGVDLESLTDKPLLLHRAFATRADCIARARDLREKYGILWSCKEAVSKAFGKGMTMDFKKIIISGSPQETFQVQGDKSFKIAGRYAVGKDSVFSLCHISPACEPRYEMHVPSFHMVSLMNFLNEENDGLVRSIAQAGKSGPYRDRPLFRATKARLDRERECLNRPCP